MIEQGEATINIGTRLTSQGALSHLKTLDDVVTDYLKRFDFTVARGPHGVDHHDGVVDHCLTSRDLSQCIERAVDSRLASGKMFSENSCIAAKAKQELAAHLLQVQDRFKQCKTFEDVYDVVSARQISGIGLLMKYCVTSRVAAYLGIHPKDYLYLHAGPAKGWKALTGKRADYRMPVASLPKALRRLSAHRIEDLFCEYREALRPEMMRAEEDN